MWLSSIKKQTIYGRFWVLTALFRVKNRVVRILGFRLRRRLRPTGCFLLRSSSYDMTRRSNRLAFLKLISFNILHPPRKYLTLLGQMMYVNLYRSEPPATPDWNQLFQSSLLAICWRRLVRRFSEVHLQSISVDILPVSEIRPKCMYVSYISRFSMASLPAIHSSYL